MRSLAVRRVWQLRTAIQLRDSAAAFAGGRRHKSSNAKSRGMDDAFSPRDRRVPVPPAEDVDHSAVGPSDVDDESDDDFAHADASAASGRQSAFDRKLMEVMNERKTILSPSTDSKLLEMVDKLEHGALQDLGMLGDPLPDPIQEPRHFHIKDVARARRRRRIPITADLARSIAREGPVPILRKQVDTFREMGLPMDTESMEEEPEMGEREAHVRSILKVEAEVPAEYWEYDENEIGQKGVKKALNFAPFGEKYGTFNDELIEVEVVHTDSTSFTRETGRYNTMRALAIASSPNGALGYGIGKGMEQSEAVDNACRQARANLVAIDLFEDRTLMHPIVGRHNNTKIVLRPTSRGRGIKGGWLTSHLMQKLGIKDATARVYNGASVYAQFLAFFNAFKNYVGPSDYVEGTGNRLFNLQDTLKERRFKQRYF